MANVLWMGAAAGHTGATDGHHLAHSAASRPGAVYVPGNVFDGCSRRPGGGSQALWRDLLT